MLIAGDLVNWLSRVCPLDVNNVRIGSTSDKATWNVPAASNATGPQQTALATALAAINVNSSYSLRTILSIYNDLTALSAGQKTNVWTDLTSGSPAKIFTDAGPNAGSMLVLHWAATQSGAGAAGITDAKVRAATLYVQDHPAYLVQPAFDATINVAGDQLS